jgi:hypothetical protein
VGLNLSELQRRGGESGNARHGSCAPAGLPGGGGGPGARRAGLDVLTRLAPQRRTRFQFLKPPMHLKITHLWFGWVVKRRGLL